MDISYRKLTFEETPAFRLIAATACQADARTPAFRRYDYEVCTIEYVESGAGYVEVNDRAMVRVNDGGVYFLPKHSSHLYYHARENPWHKLFFVVDGALMESLMSAYGLDKVTAIPDARRLRRYFAEFIGLYNQGRDNHAAALLFHEFAQAAWALLNEPENVSATPVLRLKQLLERNLDEKFSLASYAGKSGISQEHLIRSFKRSFQETPMAYRMKMRLHAAARLLSCSDLSVKEIAAATGFGDANYFSNCFKQHNGIAPSEFRMKRAKKWSE